MIPLSLSRAHAAIGSEMFFAEPSSSLGSRIVSLSHPCDNIIHGFTSDIGSGQRSVLGQSRGVRTALGIGQVGAARIMGLPRERSARRPSS
jgi:hypothetical protein